MDVVEQVVGGRDINAVGIARRVGRGGETARVVNLNIDELVEIGAVGQQDAHPKGILHFGVLHPDMGRPCGDLDPVIGGIDRIDNQSIKDDVALRLLENHDVVGTRRRLNDWPVCGIEGLHRHRRAPTRPAGDLVVIALGVRPGFYEQHIAGLQHADTVVERPKRRCFCAGVGIVSGGCDVVRASSGTQMRVRVTDRERDDHREQ